MLKVEHVIVCGHYGCGGVRAAYFAVVARPDRQLAAPRAGRPRPPRRRCSNAAADDDARIDRLCELNVVEQVRHVCHTTIVQDAWRREQPVTVHGWIYDVADGLLRDLRCTASSSEELTRVYDRALLHTAKQIAEDAREP